ncbi:MAG: multidrug efflux pump subunit AcrB [Lentimonas sp.]|jgi:multidrug efflux pump subunit AcrB
MNLAEFTIKNRLLSVIFILITLFGGWSAYKNMPRFEDPEFTIRIAQIITQYPGASPSEVAEEVAEPLETALQQLQEVDVINSTSGDGICEIKVEIKYEFSKDKSDLALIWNKVRNKMKDVESSLPPGASTPVVYDDFGDVYGIYYLLTGEGYTAAELRRYAKDLQSELLLVDGVAKVALKGESQEAIFVEISRQSIANLGLSISSIYSILAQQNAVVSAGNLQVGEQRIVIDPSGAIDSVEAIENLLVAPSADGKIIYLKDIANVWRGYTTPQRQIIRYNGQPAISMGISNVQGANVVKMGDAVNAKIADSLSLRPIGMELNEYYHQGTVVQESVDAFVLNVLAALVIVIVTLLIFMGLRPALVIGGILLLTIFATLLTMDLSGIPMHRISLGALIIALGMMVDNAIVVTEGILVGMQQGKRRLEIAKEIVTQTRWPLLGGTLVGCMAFAPIGFAPGNTAEYTGDLFWVILISLLYSWIFALTLTPLFCYLSFKETDDVNSGPQEESAFMRGYKNFVKLTLKLRWPIVAAVVAMFFVSMWGFRFVTPGFFPASTTPQLVIDYWLPQGTDISRTDEDLKKLESELAEIEGVNKVHSLVGAGALRFMLIYDGESGNSSYGQILLGVEDYKILDGLIPEIQDHIDENYPNAQAKVWRFVTGPGGGSKIEATFKGPETDVLRSLAEQSKNIMIADGAALSIKDTWRNQVSVIEPIYSETKGRQAGVSREDLAAALQTNFSGQTVGVYREGDDLLPIMVRAPEAEREGIENIQYVQVTSSVTGATVPIAQVTDGFRTIWRDGTLVREDRIWTISAQCDPTPGVTSADLLNRLRPQIEAIDMPDGYTLEWDGEIGDSEESNEELMSTLPLGFGTMVLIVVILFGNLRQPIVIGLVVPLSIIGVVWGLVLTRTPMEFMGILGMLSLSGLLIKNAIVLVDQINLEITGGKARFDAIVDSATSRMRPVMMGTLTTVLGVIPLFFDAFFKSMSVVLVFGLTFATLLTLVFIPILYMIIFKIKPSETAR